MKKTTTLTAALTFLLPLFAFVVQSQQQSPPAAKPAAQKPETAGDRDDVVRITTSLVQVDAIVTKGGRQVTDLAVADFEISEDGRSQKDH